MFGTSQRERRAAAASFANAMMTTAATPKPPRGPAPKTTFDVARLGVFPPRNAH
jgi:hypothetical protein